MFTKKSLTLSIASLAIAAAALISAPAFASPSHASQSRASHQTFQVSNQAVQAPKSSFKIQSIPIQRTPFAKPFTGKIVSPCRFSADPRCGGTVSPIPVRPPARGGF